MMFFVTLFYKNSIFSAKPCSYFSGDLSLEIRAGTQAQNHQICTVLEILSSLHPLTSWAKFNLNSNGPEGGRHYPPTYMVGGGSFFPL